MNTRIWKVSSGFPGVLELPSRIRRCSAKTWGERWGRGGKWSPRSHVLHMHVCAATAGRWVSPRTDRHHPRPFQIDPYRPADLHMFSLSNSCIDEALVTCSLSGEEGSGANAE